MSFIELVHKIGSKITGTDHEVHNMLNKLKQNKTALHIFDQAQTFDCFFMVSRLIPEDNYLFLHPIFPDQKPLNTTKSTLTLISQPMEGKCIKFTSKLLSSTEENTLTYKFSYPRKITLNDPRDSYRMALAMKERIVTTLKSPNAQDFEGCLIDFSLTGAQIAISGEASQYLQVNDKCELRFTFTDVNYTFASQFTILWTRYDVGHNTTYVGGQFEGLSADQQRDLTQAMISQQMKFCHRYL